MLRSSIVGLRGIGIDSTCRGQGCARPSARALPSGAQSIEGAQTSEWVVILSDVIEFHGPPTCTTFNGAVTVVGRINSLTERLYGEVHSVCDPSVRQASEA